MRTKLERWGDAHRKVRKKAVKLGHVVAVVVPSPDDAHRGKFEVVIGYPDDTSETTAPFLKRKFAEAYAIRVVSEWRPR